MFKCQSPNDLLANVRISLGAWELVLQWSLDVGVWSFVASRAILTHFCSISVPQWSQVFHLVSACFTWFQLSGKKIRTGRLKTHVFSYAKRTRRKCALPNSGAALPAKNLQTLRYQPSAINHQPSVCQYCDEVCV